LEVLRRKDPRKPAGEGDGSGDPFLRPDGYTGDGKKTSLDEMAFFSISNVFRRIFDQNGFAGLADPACDKFPEIDLL